MSLRKPKIALLLLAALAVPAVFTARASWARGSDGATPVASVVAASATTAPLRDGSAAKFRFLARQTSNRCDLQPRGLAAMPARMRLQGSCCSSMDLAAYRSQVRGLRSYRGLAEIPHDPYDVRVSLAARLLGYDRTIRLTPTQARTYRQAMRMSDEQGPCCCRCWRWYAFRGLSKHLIVDGHWRAGQVARIIDLVDGCGGPADHA